MAKLAVEDFSYEQKELLKEVDDIVRRESEQIHIEKAKKGGIYLLCGVAALLMSNESDYTGIFAYPGLAACYTGVFIIGRESLGLAIDMARDELKKFTEE